MEGELINRNPLAKHLKFLSYSLFILIDLKGRVTNALNS